MELFILLAGIVSIAAVPFASAMAFALREYSRARLGELLEKENRQDLLAEIDANEDRLIIVVSSLRMGFLLGMVVCLVHWLEHVGPYLGLLVALGLSLFCAVLLGIAVPHLWARHGAEPLLCRALPALKTLRLIFWPLVGWIHLLEMPIRRIAGADSGQESPAERMEKELLDAIQESDSDVALGERERRMIRGVVELHEKEVGEVMTPRTEMICAPVNASFDAVRALIVLEGHSRIPVYEENIDNLLGVLYAKDLLAMNPADPFDLRQVMRKVPFIPETKSILDLLREFQASKVHLAIVLDEYGGTAGLVSFEDILEQVVGEIEDEYEEPQPAPIQKISDDVIEVDGRVHIDELNRELGIELPEDDAYETIGGFVFSTLGKIPQPGEEFAFDNLRIRVTDAEARRINRVRLQVMPAEPEP
jgi:CBS domain containing-hemolysin-like protein